MHGRQAEQDAYGCRYLRHRGVSHTADGILALFYARTYRAPFTAAIMISFDDNEHYREDNKEHHEQTYHAGRYPPDHRDISICCLDLQCCHPSLTLITQTVEHGALGIELEAVLFIQMSLHALKFVAMQVYELTAFLALTVVADFGIGIVSFTDIFKAGRTVAVNGVLIDDPFIDQALELTVDRGLADALTLALKILIYISRSNMGAFD